MCSPNCDICRGNVCRTTTLWRQYGVDLQEVTTLRVFATHSTRDTCAFDWRQPVSLAYGIDKKIYCIKQDVIGREAGEFPHPPPHSTARYDAPYLRVPRLDRPSPLGAEFARRRRASGDHGRASHIQSLRWSVLHDLFGAEIIDEFRRDRWLLDDQVVSRPGSPACSRFRGSGRTHPVSSSRTTEPVFVDRVGRDHFDRRGQWARAAQSHQL